MRAQAMVVTWMLASGASGSGCGPAPDVPDAVPGAPDAAAHDAADPDGGLADAAPPRRLLGTTYTPVGYPGETPEAKQAFFDTHAPYGDAIAHHLAWRLSVAGAGQVHPYATGLHADAEREGFTAFVGFGFDAGGTPDLTSESEPANNTWTNAETRVEACAMAVAYAQAHQPALMFLGNETNWTYYLPHGDDWPNWVSWLAGCRDDIHAVSPGTLVATTFQYEFLTNRAAKTGFDQPPQWDAVADVEDAVDAIAFTTYPYFHYETPADLPADYYAEIAAHTTRPVLFTEIGWTANPAAPYTGSAEEQADFIPRFFELIDALDVRYVAYLARNDFAVTAVPPESAFYQIGLATPDGTPRLADAAWRAAVASP